MSSKARELFLSTVKEKSLETFVQLVLEQKGNNGEKFDLKEVITSLATHALEEVWTVLQELCTVHLLTALHSENESEPEKSKSDEEIRQSREVLQAIAKVGKESALSQVFTPDLMQTVIIFSGVLLSFPESASTLKSAIAQLCDVWMIEKLEGHETLGAHNLLHYMQRTLKDRGSKSELKLVWCLRESLGGLLSPGNSSQAILENLLEKIFCSDVYLMSPIGVNFLAYALTVNCIMTGHLHETIKSHLPHCTRRHAGIYGSVYLNAWKGATGATKQFLENECIQDLMHHAVHADRSHKKSAAIHLQTLLGIIHKENKNSLVSKLLYELYEPILWRALKVSNGHVRSNAAALFFDAFPLQDPEANNEDNDLVFLKQVKCVEPLLDDECPTVRSSSIYGTFSILYRHWELLPAAYIKSFTKKISKLAFDGSNVECRVAVFKGFAKLLENPLSHPLLSNLLPTLEKGFHDPSEKVRITFLEMLLTVKNLKSIKFWSITPPNHLLARLAVDSIPVSKRIVSLIFNSYFPVSKPDFVKLERTVSLVETNRPASRRFFQLMGKQVDLESIVNYMLLVCKALRVYARQQSSTDVDASVDHEQSHLPDVDDSQDKENINNEQFSMSSRLESSFPFNDPEVVCGLIDGCTILWKDIYARIFQRVNTTYLKALHRTFISAVPVFFMHFKDSIVIESLVYLSSLLPIKAVPMISGYCMSKLRNMTEANGCGEPQLYGVLLESMCNWDKAGLVLDTISEWLSEALKSEDKSSDGSKRGVKFREAKPSQPLLGIEFLTWMLCHPVCKKILMEKHYKSLVELSELLKTILDLTERCLLGCSSVKSAAVITESFLMLVKLQILLHDENGKDSIYEDLITFWQRVVYACLNRPTEDVVPEGYAQRRQLAIKLTDILFSAFSNGLMIGVFKGDSIPAFVEFSDQVMKSDAEELFLCQYSALTCEMCYFSVNASIEVDDSVKYIPVCLKRFLEVLATSSKSSFNVLKESDKLRYNIAEVLKTLKADVGATDSYKKVFLNITSMITTDITNSIEQESIAGPPNKFEEYPALSAFLTAICFSRKALIRDLLQELSCCSSCNSPRSGEEILSVTYILHTTMKQHSEKVDTEMIKEIMASIQSHCDHRLEEKPNQSNMTDESINQSTCKPGSYWKTILGVIKDLREKYFMEDAS